MDFSFFIILWIVILIVENVFGKKNKQLPNQSPAEKNRNENFEIPTLANDPNFPGENIKIFQDEVKPAEIRKFNQNLPKKFFQQNFDNKFENPQKNLNLNLNPESALNAVILSEIFGKPKALRRK